METERGKKRDTKREKQRKKEKEIEIERKEEWYKCPNQAVEINISWAPWQISRNDKRKITKKTKKQNKTRHKINGVIKKAKIRKQWNVIF